MGIRRRDVRLWRLGTIGGWLAVVPADFGMSRQMLRGVKGRVERRSATAAPLSRER